MHMIDLPRDLLVRILVEWLDLSCCGRLDAAYCNTALRPTFLNTLNDTGFLLDKKSFGVIDNKHILQWIWKRRIGIEAMVIPNDSKDWKFDFNVLAEYLSHKGGCVNQIGETHFNQDFYGFFSTIPKYMNSPQLALVCNKCPNLHSILDLSTDCITLMSLGSMRRTCKKLKTLSIQHHEFDYWDPTALIALVAGGDCGIIDLRLPSIEQFMGKFAVIARNLKSIQYLCFDRLRGTRKFETDNTTYLALAAHCTQLLSLRLPMTHSFCDSSLSALSTGCRNLQLLDISNCPQVTSAGLSLFAERCTALTSLNIAGCKLIGDYGIVSLATHCTNLSTLNMEIMKSDDINPITDNALLALGAHCKSLSSLNASYCDGITSAGVVAVALGCAALNKLELNYCTSLSEDCFAVLAQHCSALSYLGVKSVNCVTDEGIRLLLSGCRGLYREGLAINGCMNVSRGMRDELESTGAISFS